MRDIGSPTHPLPHVLREVEDKKRKKVRDWKDLKKKKKRKGRKKEEKNGEGKKEGEVEGGKKEKKGKISEAMGEDSTSTTIDSSSIGFKLLKKHG